MADDEREGDEIRGEPIPVTGQCAPSGLLNDRRMACPFCAQRGWITFAECRRLLIDKWTPLWLGFALGALGWVLGHR